MRDARARARQQQIIDSLIARLAKKAAPQRLAEVYLRQGDLSTLLKRFDAADRALGTALRIGQERDDTTLLRSGLRSLGLLRWHEGRHAEALEITRRALALDRECHDADRGRHRSDEPWQHPQGHRRLCRGARPTGSGARGAGARAGIPGSGATRSTRWPTSIGRWAISIARSTPCSSATRAPASICCRSSARSTSRRSRTSSCSRDASTTALETYRAAVEQSRRARHADGLVQSLRMLGNALLGLGRHDEALPCLQEAAQLFAQLEDRGSEAEMWTGIARILERRSAGRCGSRRGTSCWRSQRKRGDAQGELDAREGLARAMRAQRSRRRRFPPSSRRWRWRRRLASARGRPRSATCSAFSIGSGTDTPPRWSTTKRRSRWCAAARR